MTPTQAARAAVALSILDYLDTLRPGQKIEIERSPEVDGCGLAATLISKGEPVQQGTGWSAYDALSRLANLPPVR